MHGASLILAPLLLCALASRASEDEIAFGVTAGTTLVRSLEITSSAERISSTLRLGEVEVEDESEDWNATVERRATVTDVFESLAEGRPLSLRRTFDEIGARRTAYQRIDQEEWNDTAEFASELEGKTVVFVRSQPEDEPAVRFDEKTPGDDGLLEALVEDMDLRALLPEEPVEPGASWTIEFSALAHLLTPGGDLRLVDVKSDEPLPENRPVDGQQGSITATYVGPEAEAETRAARIRLEVVLDTQVDGEPTDLEEGGTLAHQLGEEARLEGKLLWDLEHGHALRLELTGTTETRETTALEEATLTTVFSGTTHVLLRFQRE